MNNFVAAEVPGGEFRLVGNRHEFVTMRTVRSLCFFLLEARHLDRHENVSVKARVWSIRCHWIQVACLVMKSSFHLVPLLLK